MGPAGSREEGKRQGVCCLERHSFCTGKPGGSTGDREAHRKLGSKLGSLMSGEVAPFTSFRWSSPKVMEQSTHTYMLPVLTCPDTGKGKAELPLR